MTSLHTLKANSEYTETRCVAFVCDITSENLTDTVGHDSVDFVTLIFVLSSITPEKMSSVLKNIYYVSSSRNIKNIYQTLVDNTSL